MTTHPTREQIARLIAPMSWAGQEGSPTWLKREAGRRHSLAKADAIFSFLPAVDGWSAGIEAAAKVADDHAELFPRPGQERAAMIIARHIRSLASPDALRPSAPASVDLAAFGASNAACYLYPEADQQAERAAFCAGAAHAAPASVTGSGPVAWWYEYRDSQEKEWGIRVSRIKPHPLASDIDRYFRNIEPLFAAPASDGLREALEQWKCGSCGGTGVYLNHRYDAAAKHVIGEHLPCKKCGPDHLDPIASAALALSQPQSGEGGE